MYVVTDTQRPLVLLAATATLLIVLRTIKRVAKDFQKPCTETFADLKMLGWGEQCGGKGGVCASRGQCVDTAWLGFTCPQYATCTRRNEWHWQCDPTNNNNNNNNATVTPIPTPQQPTNPSPPAELSNKRLTLIWGDEFNSSSIDTRKWEYHLGDGSDYTGVKGWGNGELQSYTKNKDNIRIENSQLVITAKRGSTGPCVNPKRNSACDPSITSGKLCSTKSFMPGQNPILVSARIKIPMAKGSFPAFWLIPMRPYSSGTGDFGTWPLSGEIDILEHVNDERVVQTTIIYGYPNQPPQFHRGSVDLGDATGEWHTYSCLWSRTAVTTWVDGRKMYTKNIEGTPVNNPMCIVLNLAMGGNWAGNDNPALPCSMYVDYVRVHEVR